MLFIGWAGPADFYAKTVGATIIEGIGAGIYRRKTDGSQADGPQTALTDNTDDFISSRWFFSHRFPFFGKGLRLHFGNQKRRVNVLFEPVHAPIPDVRR